MTAFTPEKREALRQRYLKVDTSNVADVLDTLGADALEKLCPIAR